MNGRPVVTMKTAVKNFPIGGVIVGVMLLSLAACLGKASFNLVVFMWSIDKFYSVVAGIFLSALILGIVFVSLHLAKCMEEE